MKPLTPEEAVAEGLPPVLSESEAAAEGLPAIGEPGQPGADPYKSPPMTAGGAGLGTPKRQGNVLDFLLTAGNAAMLGGAPQVEGAMASGRQNIKNRLDQLFGRKPGKTPLEAYQEQRDISQKNYAEAADTEMGAAGEIPGMFLTPTPVKALPPGASIGKHALQGFKVGAPIGALSAALKSDVDLTKSQPLEQYAKFLLETGAGGALGGGGGAVLGAGLGAVEKPMRSVARRLPMDMLGVSEPARRSMQRQGIYDEAGDELLKLVKPFRSGMRKGSLTEDAIAELERRGQGLEGSVGALDAAAPEGVVTTGGMADAVRTRAAPFESGSLQSKQVAARMNKEAENLLDALGSTDPDIGARIPLAEAERFKSAEFGPGVAKLLRHAGEPAAKTTALGETYRALKGANEEAARAVDPELAQRFIDAKRAYSRLAAPLQGANIERGGMQASDFDLGDLASGAPVPGSVLSKLMEGFPFAGMVKQPLNLAGRAYGRGAAANIAEALANAAARNTGGNIGGRGGQSLASLASPLAKYFGLLEEDEQP